MKRGRALAALADKVAVVTGASSGIGAGLAAMLADEGARVVLAARRGEQLETMAAGIRQAGGVAVPVVTDLVVDASLASLLARTRSELGPVDVLVNKAGFAVIGPGFVDTETGEVVPGANRDRYLRVDEVVEMVRYLIRLGDNVKLGPQILLRTMRNPMAT